MLLHFFDRYPQPGDVAACGYTAEAPHTPGAATGKCAACIAVLAAHADVPRTLDGRPARTRNPRRR
jgi:hypothetical protein